MINYIGGVFTTLFFSVFFVYIELVVLWGFRTLGFKFLTLVNLYKLEYNSTWIDAFLVNLGVLILVNSALTQFTCFYLPTFVGGSYSFILFSKNVGNSYLYKLAMKNDVFGILLLAFGLLSYSILYIYLKCCKSKKLNDTEKMIELTKIK